MSESKSVFLPRLSPILDHWAPEPRRQRGYAAGRANELSQNEGEEAHDRALFDRLRTGDELALSALFHRHHGALRRFAASIAGDSAADEVVQDVFIEVWKQRLRIRVQVSARGYLYRATRNRALNARRSFERRWKRLVGLDEASDIPAPALSTEADELVRAVVEATERLPERQRMAFRLRREHELTYDEIAAVMGISRNTVENHLAKATKAVRKAIPPELVRP